MPSIDSAECNVVIMCNVLGRPCLLLSGSCMCSGPASGVNSSNNNNNRSVYKAPLTLMLKFFFQRLNPNFSLNKSQSPRVIMTLSRLLSVTQIPVTTFMTGFVTRANITNLDTNFVSKAREKARRHLNSAMNFWTGTSGRRKVMVKTLVRVGEDSWTKSSI